MGPLLKRNDKRMKQKKSDKISYGIYLKHSDTGNYILVKVPIPRNDESTSDKGASYVTRRFHFSKYESPIETAVLWQDDIGVKTWGVELWKKIKIGGGLKSIQRQSVWLYLGYTTSVKKGKRTRHAQYIVEWLEPARKTKTFGVRKYGDLQHAYLAAALYAVLKEAAIKRLPTDSIELKCRKYLTLPLTGQ